VNLCQHPVDDAEDYLDVDEDGDPVCGRPAVDSLTWSDGSKTPLCALHIDLWIDDMRNDAKNGMTKGIRDEAQADLERNSLA
jgi:hypothetical protein